MPIEIRDEQYIWSSSRVHQINEGGEGGWLLCTIRYDGWGAEWDVIVPWENNPRLTKIGTFTKRALCYVNLSGTNVKKLWPSIVNIRMPDPRCPKILYDGAAAALRDERKVFIQPYGEDLLPKWLVSTKTTYGGMWVDRSHIKE